MNDDDQKQRYRQASLLYKEGKHADALALLDALAIESFGNKDILYARAMCLIGLGHYEEARAVCDNLITNHDDDRARQLKIKIDAQNPQTNMLVAVEHIRERKAKYFYLIAGGAGLIVCIAVVLFFFRWRSLEQKEQEILMLLGAITSVSFDIPENMTWDEFVAISDKLKGMQNVYELHSYALMLMYADPRVPWVCAYLLNKDYYFEQIQDVLGKPIKEYDDTVEIEMGSKMTVTWKKYGWLEFGVSDSKVIAVRADCTLLQPSLDSQGRLVKKESTLSVEEPSGVPITKPNSPSLNSPSIIPIYTEPLNGSNEIRVRNPNIFSVKAGIRAGEKGKDVDVPANGVSSVFVPNGKYDIYFVYSDKLDALFQGDSFTLNNNGIEIQIVKVINGNYGIRQVK